MFVQYLSDAVGLRESSRGGSCPCTCAREWAGRPGSGGGDNGRLSSPCMVPLPTLPVVDIAPTVPGEGELETPSDIFSLTARRRCTSCSNTRRRACISCVVFSR